MVKKILPVGSDTTTIGAVVTLIGILLFPVLSAQAQANPIRVGILVYDGVYNTELVAPFDVFSHAGSHSGGRIRVFTVAPSARPVGTAEGLAILPKYSFANAPTIDWLVVPSGVHYRNDVNNRALVEWIRTVGRRSKVVHSNCWGAFLLGAAGLLAGKQATTFPAGLDEFARRFPGVKVRRDLRLVDDRDTVTSAGGVLSYDAALYLVEKHLGLEVARKVATSLVVDWDARRKLFAAAEANPQGPRPR